MAIQAAQQRTHLLNAMKLWHAAARLLGKTGQHIPEIRYEGKQSDDIDVVVSLNTASRGLNVSGSS
jgi:hypothetical protein